MVRKDVIIGLTSRYVMELSFLRPGAVPAL
jgi:hypothetical protein